MIEKLVATTLFIPCGKVVFEDGLFCLSAPDGSFDDDWLVETLTEGANHFRFCRPSVDQLCGDVNITVIEFSARNKTEEKHLVRLIEGSVISD